jgi:hypothetical protein
VAGAAAQIIGPTPVKSLLDHPRILSAAARIKRLGAAGEEYFPIAGVPGFVGMHSMPRQSVVYESIFVGEFYNESIRQLFEVDKTLYSLWEL